MNACHAAQNCVFSQSQPAAILAPSSAARCMLLDISLVTVLCSSIATKPTAQVSCVRKQLSLGLWLLTLNGAAERVGSKI